MVKIVVGQSTAQIVADRAVQLSKAYGQKRGWTSTQGLLPIAERGLAGIQVPVRHLMYQEKGTKPYLMTSLEGRVVPMGDGRFVTARGVGQPGWVTLPGGVKKWREQKWRHPGLKPQNSMQDSINQAVDELRPMLKQAVKERLMGRPTRGDI